MRVVRSARFERMLERLPTPVRNACGLQEEILQENPRDPRLHLKKLVGMDDVYSFRITRAYRTLFIWEGDIALLFAVGNRKDIYR